MKEHRIFNEILKSFDIRDGVRSQQKDRLDRAEAAFSIEATVVEARNCKVGHDVGDRLLFDVYGNLQPTHSPERVCVYLVSQLAPVIARINEKLMQSSDFDDLYFLRYAHCPDVGVENSGYGEVAVRVRIIPRVR